MLLSTIKILAVFQRDSMATTHHFFFSCHLHRWHLLILHCRHRRHLLSLYCLLRCRRLLSLCRCHASPLQRRPCFLLRFRSCPAVICFASLHTRRSSPVGVAKEKRNVENGWMTHMFRNRFSLLTGTRTQQS